MVEKIKYPIDELNAIVRKLLEARWPIIELVDSSPTPTRLRDEGKHTSLRSFVSFTDTLVMDIYRCAIGSRHALVCGTIEKGAVEGFLRRIECEAGATLKLINSYPGLVGVYIDSQTRVAADLENLEKWASEKLCELENGQNADTKVYDQIASAFSELFPGMFGKVQTVLLTLVPSAEVFLTTKKGSVYAAKLASKPQRLADDAVEFSLYTNPLTTDGVEKIRVAPHLLTVQVTDYSSVTWLVFLRGKFYVIDDGFFNQKFISPYEENQATATPRDRPQIQPLVRNLFDFAADTVYTSNIRNIDSTSSRDHYVFHAYDVPDEVTSVIIHKDQVYSFHTFEHRTYHLVYFNGRYTVLSKEEHDARYVPATDAETTPTKGKTKVKSLYRHRAHLRLGGHNDGVYADKIVESRVSNGEPVVTVTSSMPSGSTRKPFELRLFATNIVPREAAWLVFDGTQFTFETIDSFNEKYIYDEQKEYSIATKENYHFVCDGTPRKKVYSLIDMRVAELNEIHFPHEVIAGKVHRFFIAGNQRIRLHTAVLLWENGVHQTTIAVRQSVYDKYYAMLGHSQLNTFNNRNNLFLWMVFEDGDYAFYTDGEFSAKYDYVGGIPKLD